MSALWHVTYHWPDSDDPTFGRQLHSMIDLAEFRLAMRRSEDCCICWQATTPHQTWSHLLWGRFSFPLHPEAIPVRMSPAQGAELC